MTRDLQPPPPFAALARDALFVALAAVATVQALRLRVGDRYLVPTGSMEPVLHGDPAHGDVVYVDKLADGAARRRHDLVVVAHPAEPGQLMVKRIAARGDDPEACWLDVRQGDLWLGPDAQRLQREQKDPLAARGMRATWAQAPGSPAAQQRLDLRACAPGTFALAGGAAVEVARTALRPAARQARRLRADRGGRLRGQGRQGHGQHRRHRLPLRAALRWETVRSWSWPRGGSLPSAWCRRTTRSARRRS
jgi:hypothetical protein